MGINSRKSLDPRWVDHHVITIDGFKNCQVRITRPNPDVPMVYNQSTGLYTHAMSATVYIGSARIQPYGINLDLEVSNDPTARRLVLVQIQGKDLSITNDDILTVTSAENNQDLLLYHYDIRGSIGSSMEWGTNLVCEVNLKMQNLPVSQLGGYGSGGYGE